MLLFDPDEWTEVSSSNLAGVGTKDGYLLVKFKNGDVYRYPEMSEHFDSIKEAPSVGKYFHQHVRAQPCERLRGGEWPDE